MTPEPKLKAKVFIFRPSQARRRRTADEIEIMLSNDVSPSVAQGVRRLARRLKSAPNL
jgi:hypothetical protein